MSFKKKDRTFPSKSKVISDQEIAKIVSAALRNDFGQEGSPLKQVGRRNDINIRAIKNWYSGRNAPSAGHLLLLAKYSPTIMKFILKEIGGEEFCELSDLISEFDFDMKNNEIGKIYKQKNVTINVTIKFNKRQKWFLIILKNGQKGRAEDIVQKFEVSIRTARRDIIELKQAGKIYFVGAKKTGHYEVGRKYS